MKIMMMMTVMNDGDFYDGDDDDCANDEHDVGDLGD